LDNGNRGNTRRMAVHQFRIDVPQAVLDDLRARLRRTRWPAEDVVAALAAEREPVGLSPSWLRKLMEEWRDRFDWRARERALNELPQVLVDLGGQLVHAVHVPGRGPDPLPLLLSHGWPSSVVEFTKVIPRLTDPVSFGEDPADAFTVVAPSLPGYLFSSPLPPGRSGDTPALYARLMAELGHPRFGAFGSDIGAYVTTRLALAHPDRLVGVHVTSPAEPAVPAEDELAGEERDFLVARAADREQGGGYSHVQRTRPLTLGYGLTDSPVALAAWVLDKWREWTDCGGDLLSRFTTDELLTLLTLYWVTGSIGSSFAFYRDWGLGGPPPLLAELYPRSLPGVDPRPLDPGQRITVAAAVALFGARHPRGFVERAYADLRQFSEMPRGGHFAAFEEPDLLVDDLRRFFRPLRPRPTR
jgi:pimeloyl-ACP methyl ester carboxylesterase